MALRSRTALLLGAIAVATAVAQPMAATPADAKMSCVNVKKRFQLCGEVKPWTRFVAGVGVRFQKPAPALAAR